jgi:hypothetical protein
MGVGRILAKMSRLLAEPAFLCPFQLIVQFL